MKDRSANAAVIAAVEPLKAPPRFAAAAMPVTPSDGKVIRAITSARSTTRAKISSGLRPRASEAAPKAGAVKNMARFVPEVMSVDHLAASPVDEELQLS